MKLLLLTLLLSLPLAARQRLVMLGWDANPPADNASYELFLGIIKLVEVNGTQAEVRLPFGECSITIRAVSATQVSEFSAPLIVPSVWSEVKNWVVFSEDMTSWTPKLTDLTNGIVPTESGKLFHSVASQFPKN